MSKKALFFCVLLCLTGSRWALAQSSVFTDLKKDKTRAIEYYEKGNYVRSLSILENLEKKSSLDRDLYLLMGRANHKLNRPTKAALYFSEYEKYNPDIKDEMLLEFAEIYSRSGDYQEAIEKYNKYAESHPNDIEIRTIIWRLNNIKYLYEDSVFYEINLLPFNTTANESGVTYYKNGIIFLSDRPEFGGIKKLDQSTHLPFKQWYYCPVIYDSVKKISRYGQTEAFGSELNIKYNKGNLSFYDDFDRIIFSSNTRLPSNNNLLTLNLYFASRNDGKWHFEDPFLFNSANYSTTQPYISDNGEVLYFASDMPGGIGGMDLYYTKKNSNGWTSPVNLGEEINTSGDEGHPFLHNNVLYFSSDGHEGLGGLDIYKIYLNYDYFTEPENLGYPLNSNFDDFGLVLNKEGDQGYFSSNRNETNKDDIFSVRVFLRTYPLNVKGIIKLKDPSLNIDSLYSLPDADLYLIDKRRNIEVYNTLTSSKGDFNVTIPYHSQYQLRISKEKLGSVLVSFDITRKDNEDNVYEIVVVKELFQYDIK